MKTISDLMTKIEKGILIGNKDVEISHITADSRKVVEGSLYIARKGFRVNGLDFAADSIKKGAKAIMTDQEIDFPCDVPIIKVDNIQREIENIVPYFYDYPGKKMRIIGITGTNGKTSSTYMLRDVLRDAGYKVGVIGTIKIMIEDEELPIDNTTPDIVELQNILSEMAKRGIDYVVMEVSSHALTLNRIFGIEFDVAIFTNLTQDHLDFHKTMEEYGKAKGRLFQLLAENPTKPNKCAVINLDDKYGKSIILDSVKTKVLTYGIDNDVASLNVHNVEIKASGASFKLDYQGKTYTFNLKITGYFNIYNILGVIGALINENIDMDIIKNTLEEFAGVAGRFELVRGKQDFSVIVDYAHTPDGLINVLNTAREICKNRLIVVFGCGGDRDKTKRPIMGEVAAKLSDYVVVTSDNPRTENPDLILEDIKVGVLKYLKEDEFTMLVDRKEAIGFAINMAKKDDIILIAGKGHENYQILNSGTIHFDDREIAEEFIGRL